MKNWLCRSTSTAVLTYKRCVPRLVNSLLFSKLNFVYLLLIYSEYA
ncbi:recombination protein F [Rickettsia endosymbiont of Ixodes scapularis]|nr:recombination protein F [Rickettsia endosymbiont of Ixodes scapularis]